MSHLLSRLGIQPIHSGAFHTDWIPKPGGELLPSVSPTDGQVIASVRQASKDDYETVMRTAQERFASWRMIPAPIRGEYIRQLGNALRDRKAALGSLVAWEMGKIQTEGEGEVQEMVDICDFAVGLSRQLYGLTMHSERPGHRMYEQWHPLGTVGIISAFNFPVAVWAWNAAIAAVCGNTLLWKPSEKTPLTAVAVQEIVSTVTRGTDAEGVFGMAIGTVDDIGETLIHDRRAPLISATGSCRMGRRVGAVVHGRLGRTILELGGNNAIIVTADANLDLAIPGILFGAVGTAGQRCTSTRRVFLERSIASEFTERLLVAYAQVRIGDPRDAGTLMGPLIDDGAVDQMMTAIADSTAQGGEVIYGGTRIDRPGCFVEPTIIRARHGMEVCRQETFAPILYLFGVDSIDEAIAEQNDVDQGLSSAIFTTNLISAETFLSHRGSDCGIANVNIGTSGAEIGGAFGGEKDTGGGRESGSDAWKGYMRRQTCTVNWSSALPLAQGISFG